MSQETRSVDSNASTDVSSLQQRLLQECEGRQRAETELKSLQEQMSTFMQANVALMKQSIPRSTMSSNLIEVGLSFQLFTSFFPYTCRIKGNDERKYN